MRTSFASMRKFAASTSLAAMAFTGIGAASVLSAENAHAAVPVSAQTQAVSVHGHAKALADARADTVINFAKQQLGKPYELNTAGPDTFDCSGLTQAAFAQVGVELPRKSIDQHVGLTEVSAADRQPGDLIWWTDKTHVAIYIGDDQLIDASSSHDSVVQRAVYDYDGPARYFRALG